MSFPLVFIGPADQLSLYIYAFTPEHSLMMFILSVYENLCLIGPVHIDMEEAQRFIASVCGLALRGRPKQTSTCSRYILKDVLRLAPGLEVLKFTTIPHNFDLISRMPIEE